MGQKHGAEGNEADKSKDRIWLEKEQPKGGTPSFRRELHTAGAEIACSRTQVPVPIPHQHCQQHCCWGCS